MEILILLVFILKLINCQIDDDNNNSDYDNNYIDIDKIVNCGDYDQSLLNCTCSQSGLINCAGLGFNILPTRLTTTTNETSKIVNILFNNNSIRQFSQIKTNNGLIIKSINLAQNKLEDVIETNETSNDLEILILNDNIGFDLNKLSKLNLFSNLKILHINKIKSPLLVDAADCFVNSKTLPNIKEISIENTNLKFSSNRTGFNELKNLEVLFLRNNNLTEIPCDRLKSFDKLKTLKYEMNNASSSSSTCFSENKNLLKLYLREIDDLKDENSLTKLFDENSRLEYLDVSKNRMFKGLPYELLKKLKEIKELFINIIEVIEQKNLTVYQSLLHLDLHDSIINDIPKNAFYSFPNLIQLNLDNCSIESLDTNSFNGLSNLEHLFLSHNNLKTVEKFMNLNYSKLVDFDLQSNKFNCECSLLWIVNDIKMNPSLIDNLICLNITNGTEKLYSKVSSSLCSKPNNTREIPFLLYLCTGVFLLVFTVSLVTGVCYLQMKKRRRNNQYRYTYFSQPPVQDDPFETMQDLPVYRDTTISLQIQDSNNNIASAISNFDSQQPLTTTNSKYDENV